MIKDFSFLNTTFWLWMEAKTMEAESKRDLAIISITEDAKFKSALRQAGLTMDSFGFQFLEPLLKLGTEQLEIFFDGLAAYLSKPLSRYELALKVPNDVLAARWTKAHIIWMARRLPGFDPLEGFRNRMLSENRLHGYQSGWLLEDAMPYKQCLYCGQKDLDQFSSNKKGGVWFCHHASCEERYHADQCHYHLFEKRRDRITKSLKRQGSSERAQALFIGYCHEIFLENEQRITTDIRSRSIPPESRN